MTLADIYFAYKNYININYGVRGDLIAQLIKKYDIDERLDRITTRCETEDIEKSNILIKKGYYALSFNSSKVSSIDQIKNFYLQHTGIGCDICFATDRGYLRNSDVHVIVEKKEDITRIAKHVELQKATADIPNEQLFEKIQMRSPYVKKQKTTDLFTINKKYLLIKGVVNFSYEDDSGEEYPYFGILLQNDGTIMVEVFEELLHVVMIDGKYYFVSYWQEPECGKRGLMIYTVEGKSLEKVFSDHSEAT